MKIATTLIVALFVILLVMNNTRRGQDILSKIAPKIFVPIGLGLLILLYLPLSWITLKIETLKKSKMKKK